MNSDSGPETRNFLLLRKEQFAEKQGIMTASESTKEILDDLEPSKKVRQSVKVIGRTMYCFACYAEDPSPNEVAAFYCACGMFLCTFHMIRHKCLIISRMEYDKEITAGLA